jgi:hypothetical protein
MPGTADADLTIAPRHATDLAMRFMGAVARLEQGGEVVIHIASADSDDRLVPGELRVAVDPKAGTVLLELVDEEETGMRAELEPHQALEVILRLIGSLQRLASEHAGEP